MVVMAVMVDMGMMVVVMVMERGGGNSCIQEDITLKALLRR